QKQRCVTKLHRGAGLDGERRDLFDGDLRDEFANAVCDGDTVLVELVLPEHAGEDRTPQGLLGCEDGRRCAFVGARAREMGQLEDVQLHVVAPPFVRIGETSPGNSDTASYMSLRQAVRL